MEIVGSVAPDEVPREARRTKARPSIWADLTTRAITDHSAGRITVVKLKDRDEYKQMLNNVGSRLKTEGYRARPILLENGTELRVFLELVLRDEAATAPVNGSAASG